MLTTRAILVSLLMSLVFIPVFALESEVFYYNEGSPGSDPIRFVGDHSYAPIEFLEDGLAKGVFAEFLPYLAKELGRNVEYQLMDWGEAQRRVREGEADVLTVFSPNPERDKIYTYSDEFLTFDFKFFVRSDDILIHSIDDLYGRKVGVTKGGTPGEIISQYSDQIELVFIETMEEGFQKVLTGEIDAVATTEWVGAYIIQKTKLKGLKPVEKAFHSEVAPMGLRQDDLETLEQINRALAELKKKRVMARLAEQWSSLEIVYLTKKTISHLQFGLFAAFSALLILISFSFIFILKRQVKERTRSLTESVEELRKSQNTIVQLEKMQALSILVKGVAHELNTPLGNAKIAIDVADQQLSELLERLHQGQLERSQLDLFLELSTEANKMANTALRSASKLIRDFGELSIDENELATSPFMLNQQLDEIVIWLQESLMNAKAVIKVSCPKGIEMHSLPDILNRVLIQVVENSLHHAFKGVSNPKVTVEVDDFPQHVCIHVTDNGTGMSAKDSKHIFDPFYTTEHNTHHGLGLSVVFNLVSHALEGSISCTSEEGQGTKFDIHLPKSI